MKVAVTDGSVIPPFHTWTDHPERNISMDDIIAGLTCEEWTLAKTEYDAGPKYKNWKYYIKTKDAEGDELLLLISANPERLSIKVITTW
jgi:hypothetical protein